MRIMTTADVKAHFAEVLERVKSGETVIVSYGRRKEKIAAIVPYAQVATQGPRPLGLLQGKVRYRIGDDFAITDALVITDDVARP